MWNVCKVQMRTVTNVYCKYHVSALYIFFSLAVDVFIIVFHSFCMFLKKIFANTIIFMILAIVQDLCWNNFFFKTCLYVPERKKKNFCRLNDISMCSFFMLQIKRQCLIWYILYLCFSLHNDEMRVRFLQNDWWKNKRKTHIYTMASGEIVCHLWQKNNNGSGDQRSQTWNT